MKFPLFKRRKEIELCINALRAENAELIQQISDEKISKNKKVTELLNEIVRLKKENDRSRKMFEEAVDTCRTISSSNDSLREMLDSADKRSRSEIEKLQTKNFELRLLIPEKFPIDEVMRFCANGAWLGGKSDRTFESVDGKIKLYFKGTVYEPTYEYFTAGCCVYYLEEGMERKKSLYTVDSRNVAAYRNEKVESGSVEAIKQYLLEKNIGFKEI